MILFKKNLFKSTNLTTTKFFYFFQKRSAMQFFQYEENWSNPYCFKAKIVPVTDLMMHVTAWMMHTTARMMHTTAWVMHVIDWMMTILTKIKFAYYLLFRIMNLLNLVIFKNFRKCLSCYHRVKLYLLIKNNNIICVAHFCYGNIFLKISFFAWRTILKKINLLFKRIRNVLSTD